MRSPKASSPALFKSSRWVPLQNFQNWSWNNPTGGHKKLMRR
jgi:hypothetical protein